MSAPEDHRLSPQEHAFYREEHAETYLGQTRPSDQPSVVFLAGQPGAGKSGLTKRTLAEYEQDGAVVVDIDELRASHPDYARLQRIDNRSAAGHVQADASQWGDELIEDAAKGRRNIVIDGTMKDPDSTERLSRDLHQQGYRVEVRAMATRHEDSRLGIHDRYEGAKRSGTPGRWVPVEEVHDPAYGGMRDSLERMNQSPHVDRIEVHGRALDTSEPTRRLYGGAPGAGDPVEALDRERARPRTPQEQQYFDQRSAKVESWIKERDPDLSEPENTRFAEWRKELATKQKATDPQKLSAPQTNQATPEAPSPDPQASVRHDPEQSGPKARASGVSERWRKPQNPAPKAQLDAPDAGHSDPTHEPAGRDKPGLSARWSSSRDSAALTRDHSKDGPGK